MIDRILQGIACLILYINDLPNCSDPGFADDTNLFASAWELKSLENLISSELEKVKEWCDVSNLSMNLIKTNYRIIKIF